MSEPNSTPDAGGARRFDAEHERGEAGTRGGRPASAAPKDPVAHDVPGAVPGNTGIDDTGARMIPRGNAAGGTSPGGTTADDASGGAGLPGGTPPRDDDRRPKRV